MPDGYAPFTGNTTRRLSDIDGVWNGTPLRLGAYYLWVDSTGDLRINEGVPESDTDGAIVGTQS